ncbi:hypothetical protein ISR92_03345 [Patescibacteria group bacterium]|nr:hypothetical protein [Patescibacteria group bacterium]
MRKSKMISEERFLQICKEEEVYDDLAKDMWALVITKYAMSLAKQTDPEKWVRRMAKKTMAHYHK